LDFLLFLLCFVTCTIGAVCGIGGGIIIKPVFDALHAGDAAVTSFLSNCTVFSMSACSLLLSAAKKDAAAGRKTGRFLAPGSAVGGILGMWLFSLVKAYTSNPARVGAVQAACLGLITLAVLLLTCNRAKIKTLRVQNPAACLCIGVFLGVVSSFLGIGGGPLNLAVLFLFFSMDGRNAVRTSLIVIFFGQLANLAATFVTGNIPEFSPLTLAAMAAGGILGGFAGRPIHRHISDKTAFRLLIGLFVVIFLICVMNVIRTSLPPQPRGP